MKFLENKRNLATAKQATNWGKERRKKKENILKYVLFAHLVFANTATVTRLVFCHKIWFCWLKFLADLPGDEFDHWSCSHPHSSQRGFHSMFQHPLVDNTECLGTQQIQSRASVLPCVLFLCWNSSIFKCIKDGKGQ